MEQHYVKTSLLCKIIDDNKVFIILFVLFAALLSVLLIVFGNQRLFLYVNSYYSESADFFFLLITHLGNAIVAIILVSALLWISVRESLTLLIVTILLAIIITVLKNYTFPEIDRPVEYFRLSKVIRLVPGYHPPELYSFPSGHAATVFSICLYLSFLIKSHYFKFILFVVALLVCFSRVYLSAHFPADILAGSLIAVPVTILCYSLSRRVNNAWIDRRIRLTSTQRH